MIFSDLRLQEIIFLEFQLRLPCKMVGRRASSSESLLCVKKNKKKQPDLNMTNQMATKWLQFIKSEKLIQNDRPNLTIKHDN